MPIAAADIQAQRFRIVFRGYDVEAVDVFLDRVQRELEQLMADRDPDDQAIPEDGPPPLPSPRSEGDDAAGAEAGPAARALRTLLRAEDMADQMLAEAAAEVDQMRARAQGEAHRIVAEARLEGARVEAEERLRHQREVDALALRRDELQGEVDRLSGLQQRARQSLQAWLAAHHDLLESPPVAVAQDDEPVVLTSASAVAA